jgi:hypothetical protein
MRTAHDLAVISAVVTTHVVRVTSRIIIAIPGDIMHGKCLKNAGPACDHEDCPHLECHPGVHKLEERYAAPESIAA